MGVVVGLDVGTTGCRAVAVGEDGGIAASSESGYPTQTPRPGWSEQDPAAWAAAASDAIAALDVGSVAGIGLSGQMHGLVVLDDGGRSLRPSILWNDQRSGLECRAIEDAVGREELIRRSGNRALTGFTAPKLAWVRTHEPEVAARIAHVCLPKDLVRFRLTGELGTDVSDASGTLWLDTRERRWSSETLSELDVDPAWLPPVLESGALSGHTSSGVPVAAGSGDQAAAGLSVGADRPGIASVVIGTSGVVASALDRFAPEPDGRLHTFCHARPGLWQAMGVMLSAGGSLAWLRSAMAPTGTFEELEAEAAAWPPGADGLLFLPYLTGERTPHADPDARAAFLGLEVRHDRGAMARAVMEGVAFGLRDSLELLRSIGISFDRVRLTGGGARSELWARIAASVLGVPVERPCMSQGSAFGAAMLGAVVAGWFPQVSEAVDAWVSGREPVEPIGAWQDVYEDAYERFDRAYPATRALVPGSDSNDRKEKG